MRKTEQGSLLCSFIAASVLCFAPNVVQGASLSVSSTSGSPGSQVTFTVSLSSEGAVVAGAQNDIAFDASTPVATRSSCLRTSSKACTTDADCPLLDATAPDKGREPCGVRPDCTALASGAEAFFGCTGTDCAGMRAFVFTFANPIPPLPDGPLYSCKVNIAPTASEGDKPLTLSLVLMSDAGSPGPPPVPVMPVCGTTDTPACGATDGKITVGPGGTVCVDDCNGDSDVFGNEITIAINILIGNADISTCRAADANKDGDVFGNEITLGLVNLTNGCVNFQTP